MQTILEIIFLIFLIYLFSPNSDSSDKKSNNQPAVQTTKQESVLSEKDKQDLERVNKAADNIISNSMKATDPNRFRFSDSHYSTHQDVGGLVITMTFVAENVQSVSGRLGVLSFLLRKDGEGSIEPELYESGISDTLRNPTFKNWDVDLLPGDQKLYRLSFHTADNTPIGWKLYFKDHLNGNKLKLVSSINN